MFVNGLVGTTSLENAHRDLVLVFVCHQLVPHLVPNSPRVPLRNVLWGLGVCAVLGQVRFAV